MNMKTIILSVSLIILTSSVFSNLNGFINNNMTLPETMLTQKTVKLKCSEMSCKKCVKSIETSVNKLPGISGLVIDLGSKMITVSFDDTKTDVQTVLNAIAEAGYEAEVIEE